MHPEPDTELALSPLPFKFPVLVISSADPKASAEQSEETKRTASVVIRTVLSVGRAVVVHIVEQGEQTSRGGRGHQSEDESG